MSRIWKALLLCLALAALPLQSLEAAAMVFCSPDQHTDAPAPAHSHAPGVADDSKPPVSGGAGHEVLCHHCTATALPAVLPQLDILAGAHQTPGSAPHLFLFFPQQPQRPPLA